MPWCENRRGEQLWYEEQGAGCVVVLLHGWCMSSAVWKYQFDGLTASNISQQSATIRLIAPDLRGHGRSRGVAGQLNFESLAEDLVDLFDALMLDRVVLIGWSMGAQVALQSCAELKNRLAGLVLVSATPCFTASDDFPYGLADSQANGMRVKVQRNMLRALAGFHTRMFAQGELENHSAASEIKRLLSIITLPDHTAALGALAALARTDMRHLLPTIAIPTLIVNGDEDVVCTPEASNYLKSHMPSAEQVVFSHCGHAPFLTQSDKFNAEITGFIRSVRDQNA